MYGDINNKWVKRIMKWLTKFRSSLKFLTVRLFQKMSGNIKATMQIHPK